MQLADTITNSVEKWKNTLTQYSCMTYQTHSHTLPMKTFSVTKRNICFSYLLQLFIFISRLIIIISAGLVKKELFSYLSTVIEEPLTLGEEQVLGLAHKAIT